MPKPKRKVKTQLPDPTEEEIAARAAEIREGWSDYEHYQRAGAMRKRVEILEIARQRNEKGKVE